MSERSEKDIMIEELWRAYLTGDFSNLHWRKRNRIKVFTQIMRLLPTDPRCPMCNVPFHGIGAPMVRLLLGRQPSNLNPQICNQCEIFANEHQGGAEIELSMLFADVRGSTSLAEGMTASEFSQLINRFYEKTTDVLTRTYALIDRLVGDEIIGYYVPGFAGSEHARLAVEAAQKLLRVTGHSDQDGPWIPVGAGVHTGTAFVGSVGTPGGVTGITALGDAVNTAARLASQAGPGEIIVSEDAYTASGLDLEAETLERRQLELKGRSEPVNVLVMHVSPS